MKRRKVQSKVLSMFLTLFLVVGTLGISPQAIEETDETTTEPSTEEVVTETANPQETVEPTEEPEVVIEEPVEENTGETEATEGEEVSEEPIEVETNTAETDARFAELLAAMYADIPEGQEKVSYINNYESMEPEPYTQLKGIFLSTIDSGKNILTLKVGSAGSLDKSPYFSSAYYRVNFRHDMSPQVNGSTTAYGMGFLLKTGEKAVEIRMEQANTTTSENTWTLFIGTSYFLIRGTDIPKLDPNVDYSLEILHDGTHLTLALDGEIFYDQDLAELGTVSEDLGQFGVTSKAVAYNMMIDDIYMEGVGSMNKPLPPTQDYFKDYEDGDKGNWTASTVANVIDDGSGVNNVLKLKAIADGHYLDLASPQIDRGSLSLDFKMINPGSGLAFDFRGLYSGGKVAPLNAFSYAPHEKDWIWENGKRWSGTLNVGQPTLGTWNNLIINFEEDRMVIYMNKEKMGEYTWDGFAGSPAGHFGVRLRPGAEVYVDNLLYTTETIVPEFIQEYNNTFEEGVPGDWQGDVERIVDEGENKVLELKTAGVDSLLDTEIELDAGTALARVKPISTDVGFLIASTDTTKTYVQYKDGKWVLTHNSQDIEFADNVKAFDIGRWNTWGVAFKSDEVTLNVNGQDATVQLPGGESLSSGTFGLVSESVVYLDDLVYTEKALPFLTASNQEDKIYYLNYFDLEGVMTWENLDNASQSNGVLTGTIAANTVATEKAVDTIENGIYQIKFESNKVLGVQLGDIKIVQNGEEWTASIAGGTPETIGSYKINENEEAIIRVQRLRDKGNLWINNINVGEFDISGSQPGLFGLLNNSSDTATVKIDAVGIEEIRLIQRDFEESLDMDWVRIDGTGRVNAIVEDGALKATVFPVVAAVDQTLPAILDQKIEFDFTTSVDDGLTTGGRYGFIIRGTDEQYVSIVCDVAGKWSVGVDGNDYRFLKTYSLAKNETYHMEASIVGSYVSFAIVDSEGVRTDMGSLSIPNLKELPGQFGLRGWYSSKVITIDNLSIEEYASLPLFQLSPKLTTLEKDNFSVVIDQNLPRIIQYQVDDKVLATSSEIISDIIINGKAYTPQVSGTLSDDKTSFTYEMKFSEIDVEMTAKFEILDNQVLSFEVTDLQENGDFLINTISLGNSSLGRIDSQMENATIAWAKSTGKWHGLTEDIIEDLSAIEKNRDGGVTMAMMSGDGLALSVENNVIYGGEKINVVQEKKTFVNEVTFYPGEWMIRHPENGKEKLELLPMMKVVVTEDANDDAIVDWQDGAVAYRRHILVRPFAADDMANNMMYIPFNFASNATDTFINSLDQSKVLYNYTDGFGQMLLHKGYQDEGHDSGIPSYSSVGVRQGGAEDLQYLIAEGDKYNVKVGVHLNATEYHLDANELKYENLDGSSATGPYNKPTGSVYKPGFDKLLAGWDWMDTSFYVNQTRDVISGELERRFESLAEKVRTDDGLTLDFYYIDVYTGNDYNAYKLLQYANDLGIKVGTEFAGPLEPGANFVHWGPDLGYPNKGNGSLVYRMVKNDQDIFVGNALFKGQKIAVVSTWGNSKPDIEQGIFVFYNEVLPTKYMQHYGVLKVSEDEVQFEGNVVSSRNHSTGKIELSKDGQIISTWEDTGTTTSETVRHTAEANSLIPWEWDNDNNVLPLTEGSKLYHWNTTGDSTTWTLTDKFKTASSYDLYELTQQGRVKVATIPVVNGKLTISQAKKNTPYVLYPAGTNAEEYIPTASNWGEGSAVLDFAFNSQSVGDTATWKTTDGNATIETVQGRGFYSTSKEMNVARLNRYLQINGQGDTIYQDIKVTPGTGYELEIWTKTPVGRKSTLEIEVDGEVYSNYVSGLDGVHQSNFKYRGDTWQRITVTFDVPEGVTDAQVRLIAEAGNGVVLYDDAKMWEHIVKEDYAKKEGYAVYEDFENVAQGYGAFEYIGGKLQTQLKQRTENAIASPDAGVQGPLFTWVLNGNTSLKLVEATAGMGVKSNENEVKLEPNTDYVVGFNYTMEANVIYVLSIASRTAPSVVLQKNLEVFASQGDGKTYKNVEFEFTTGDYDDYQVSFMVKQIVASGRSDARAFILDDFYIREAAVVIEKYSITTLPSTNGSFEVDKTEARENELVTVTATPDEGYVVDEIKVNGEVVQSPFEMPAEDAEVSVSFKLAADKTSLEDAIENAENKDLSNYTEESVQALEDVLTEAKELLENDDATQDEVDQMIDRINQAIEDLVEVEDKPSVVTVDKGSLEDAIKAKGNESASKYTEESYAKYEDALTFARQVLANPYASQADVINAVIWLTNAYDGLEVKTTVGPTDNNGSGTGGGGVLIPSTEGEPEATEEPEVEPTPETTPEVTEKPTPTSTPEVIVEKETSGGLDLGAWFMIGGALILVIIGGVWVYMRKE